MAYSDPPTGRARWTLELLADEMVQRTEHEELSRKTVRRRLGEQSVRPWQRKMWCIPCVDTEYVARMEDVLDLYSEAPDPRRPVVCFDETPIQLIGETQIPWPALSSACFAEFAKPVTGSPSPSRERICSERSLSRDRPMATDSFRGQTPIISNWRRTARP